MKHISISIRISDHQQAFEQVYKSQRSDFATRLAQLALE